MFRYGDVVEIGPNARYIVGRPRDMEKKIADVANVVMYKSGSTLVVVDDGATPGFREYLNKAADQLKPFDKAVLIITHGHTDHTGNNGWIDTLGVPAMAYMSDHDVAMMRDQVGAFAPLVDAVRPFVPGLPAGKQFMEGMIAQFGELDLEMKSLTFFETLPLEEIEVGETIWNGWRLLDGDVFVLQSTGHTGGHVAVFFPAIRHLHLADETTSYYQAFLCGHAQLNLLTIERVAKAVKQGAVKSITDGHSFALRQGREAADYLDRLVYGALAFDAAILRVLRENPDGITVGNLSKQVGAAPELKDAPHGDADVKPNPLLQLMQVLNKVKELGIAVPDDAAGLLKFPR